MKEEIERLVSFAPMKANQSDRQPQDTLKSDSVASSSEPTLVDSDAPRPWLTVEAVPMPLRDDPLTLLDAFDLANDYPTSWIMYYGDDPNIIIARRMRRLCLKYNDIVTNSTDPEQLMQAAVIRDIELPDLALLLMEEAVLSECLNETTRKQLQAISETNLEFLSEQAGALRKEAANTMLMKPARIWRLRYDRYKSKTLVVPVSHPRNEYVVLQVVPRSITDHIHGEEPVVIRNVDSNVRVPW